VGVGAAGSEPQIGMGVSHLALGKGSEESEGGESERSGNRSNWSEGSGRLEGAHGARYGITERGT
jgi:hypothetical protein